MSGGSGVSDWTGVARWEEPHHPGPWVRWNRHATPLLPTLQHNLAPTWERIRRTELLRVGRRGRGPLDQAVFSTSTSGGAAPGQGPICNSDCSPPAYRLGEAAQ